MRLTLILSGGLKAMTNNLPVLFVEQFTTNVQFLSQQKGSLLTLTYPFLSLKLRGPLENHNPHPKMRNQHPEPFSR